jgi:hypothetical protein
MSEPCNCLICMRHAAFVRALSEIPEDGRRFWEHIYDQLNGAEFDADYYRAIVEGTWPDADKVIHQSRISARVGDRKDGE